MEKAIDWDGGRNSGSFSVPALRSRARIVAAAADVLKAGSEGFSVQRVARRAGISARAVYGHFSSGAELARTARLSTLQAVVARLPVSVGNGTDPITALRQFAREFAAALEAEGASSLFLSRQDDAFRLQYRRLLRRPLIREVEVYLLRRRPDGQFDDCSHSQLAELLVTSVESIIVNHDAELMLELDCEEAIDRVVQAICVAYDI